MKIVIIGAGEVGYYLAKKLITENHDITIVEIDEDRYKRAYETLDAIVINGNGAGPQTLESAGVSNADVLVAVSGNDEVNILASIIAKKMGVKKCIARVRNEEFTNSKSVFKPEEAGIDLLIYPEKAAADEIVSLVESSFATKVVDFENGKLQIMVFQLTDNSPIINRTIQEISTQNPELPFLCLCINRENKILIPRGKAICYKGDSIYLIAKRDDISEISKIVGFTEKESQNVMILGAGKVGKMVAANLSKTVNVRLIEERREVAESVAEELRDTTVLYGDGTDIDFLTSEHIEEMDCFIATSGNEQTNLLSCLLAKYLGVKRVIIHIATHEYIPLMNKIGIGAVVSKNIATVNAIMKFLRRGNVVAVSLFDDIDAEAIEMIPKRGSLVTKRALKDLDISDDMIIGAIVRGSDIIIPRGETQIQADDKVIVFLKPHLITKVEKYFN